jgi:hypothetical protein
MAYRATGTESRVTVGDWVGDLTKGQVLKVKTKTSGNVGYVPQDVADYLVDHGLLVKCDDKAEDNPWFDSEDPDLNGGTKTDANHGPITNVRPMA